MILTTGLLDTLKCNLVCILLGVDMLYSRKTPVPIYIQEDI